MRPRRPVVSRSTSTRPTVPRPRSRHRLVRLFEAAVLVTRASVQGEGRAVRRGRRVLRLRHLARITVPADPLLGVYPADPPAEVELPPRRRLMAARNVLSVAADDLFEALERAAAILHIAEHPRAPSEDVQDAAAGPGDPGRVARAADPVAVRPGLINETWVITMVVDGDQFEQADTLYEIIGRVWDEVSPMSRFRIPTAFVPRTSPSAAPKAHRQPWRQAMSVEHSTGARTLCPPEFADTTACRRRPAMAGPKIFQDRGRMGSHSSSSTLRGGRLTLDTWQTPAACPSRTPPSPTTRLAGWRVDDWACQVTKGEITASAKMNDVTVPATFCAPGSTGPAARRDVLRPRRRVPPGPRTSKPIGLSAYLFEFDTKGGVLRPRPRRRGEPLRASVGRCRLIAGNFGGTAREEPGLGP